MTNLTAVEAARAAVAQGQLSFIYEGNEVILNTLLTDGENKYIMSIDEDGICPLYDYICLDTVLATPEEVIAVLIESEHQLELNDELLDECFGDTDFPY